MKMPYLIDVDLESIYEKMDRSENNPKNFIQ